jgi:type IV fimbrial biogenesis protein FimT
MRTSSRSGFSVIELVIVLAIVAILALLVVPSMKTWVANSKVRTIAESLQNDLRTAQSEALKRSRQVVFVMTTSTTQTTGNVSLAAASTSGSNWYADVLPVTSGNDDAAKVFLVNTVGSQYSATVATKNSGSATAVLCFNSEGRLASNSSTGLSFSCAVPSGTSLMTFDLSLSGADRPLRVEVQQGGRVRVCDPAKVLSSTVPDGCTS